MTTPECGNTSPEVKFDTLSGLLVVKRAAGPQGQLLLQMSLPLAPATGTLPPSLTIELLHDGPSSIGGVQPTRCVYPLQHTTPSRCTICLFMTMTVGITASALCMSFVGVGG